jgi:hypothetical protein
MKKEYATPEIEISVLEAAKDILTGSTSGGVTAGGVTDNDGYSDWI